MKNLTFKGFAALLIVIFLRIPLGDINSHTYTVGVSNDYSYDFSCFNCFYAPTTIQQEFTEIKEFNSN